MSLSFAGFRDAVSLCTAEVLWLVLVTFGVLVRCVDVLSLMLTTLDVVVSFVVIIVVGGTADAAIPAAVVPEEVVTSVVTLLLGTGDAVVA